MTFRATTRHSLHAWIAPICCLLLAGCANLSHLRRPAVHEVQPGDTVARIARAYGVPPERLARVNDLRDPDLIHTGQRLVIPGGARLRHRVRAGEAPQSIARRYGVPLSTILAANRLRSSDAIAPGRVLELPRRARLPARVAAPSPDPTPAVVAPPPRAPVRDRPSGEALARAQRLIESAESRYMAADFADAHERARQAEALAANGDGGSLGARASFVRGAALAGLGDDDGAVAAFARMCDYDCAFAPPDTWVSPRLRALLEQSRERVGR